LNEPWHGARPDLDERFRKARQLLSDPHQTSQSAVETLEDYDIEYIVINTASWIDDPSRVIMPFYSQQTLLFLERNSRCFEREYADATLHIYRYTHQCAGVALQGKDQPAQLESKATAPVKVLGVQMTRDLTLVTVSLPPGGTVAPGQALDITLVWQAVEPVMQPYAISTEILCPYPELDRPYGKLFRKAREIRSGQALKANEFHWLTIPLGDVQSGQFIYEQVALDLPMNMGEGRCSVAVFLLGRGSDELRWRPLLPDIFMENRYLYNGAEIAELTVARSLD
jgi:hypothetical protein